MMDNRIHTCNPVNRTFDKVKPPLYNEGAKEVLL